jgi:hypothetical protein
VQTHTSVELHAGRGIPGDRYFDGTGTFSASEKHGQQLTLIEALDSRPGRYRPPDALLGFLDGL